MPVSTELGHRRTRSSLDKPVESVSFSSAVFSGWPISNSFDRTQKYSSVVWFNVGFL